MLKDSSLRFKFFHFLEALINSIVIFVFIGLLIIIIGSIMCNVDSLYASNHENYWSWSEWPVTFTIISMVVVGIISICVFLASLKSSVPGGIWLKEIKPNTIIYNTETKKIAEVVSNKIILLTDHLIFKEPYKFFNIPIRQTIGTTIHPVTTNPKVRNIKCHLELRIKEINQKNLQKVFDFLNNSEMWEVGDYNYHNDRYDANRVVWIKPIQSLLFDFGNFQSKQLSELFNPLRKEQQETFQSLVHTYFDPYLDSSGIEIHSCSFSIS